MNSSSDNYQKSTWRLIISPPMTGMMNMALDSAILSAVESGAVPPTLRLYSWNPPCLSVGYSQPFKDINQDRLDSLGWDVVRRPTGGRAILHTNELTYAVIGPKTDQRLQGGLLESYRRLSRALYESLLLLGLPVEIHQGKNPLANQQPVCFENPSDFEITVNGKKIIGSAQARKKQALLQHGSLPLEGDLTRITQVLNYQTSPEQADAATTLLDKATTVAQTLGNKITWKDAANAFIAGFSKILNLELVEGNLTRIEADLAEEFYQDQYNNQVWTKQI
jgi:lipoate-protein ligase A